MLDIIPYRRVKTFADDAITVRVKHVDGKLYGAIDFPSFLCPDGRHMKAPKDEQRPITEALAIAEKLLPNTPFAEIVILYHREAAASE